MNEALYKDIKDTLNALRHDEAAQAAYNDFESDEDADNFMLGKIVEGLIKKGWHRHESA